MIDGTTIFVNDSVTFNNNDVYRKHLTSNADSIMATNKSDHESQSYVYTPSTSSTKNKNNNGPYLFNNIHDNSQPMGFETNGAKSAYLSREQLNAKTFNKYKR